MATHVPPGGSLGGIVRYTVELAQALERREDVELHLLTSPQAAEPLSDLVGCGDRVITVPGPGALTPAVERYVVGSRLKGFDVIHGAKHLLPRNATGKTVLTVHDMLLFDRPSDFPLVKRRLLRHPYSASLRQADALVCVSAATADRVRRWAPPLARRTSVVPLATGSALLTAAPEPVPGLSGRTFALVVGDSQPRKNISMVLAAWKQVVHERPEAVLVLVGPPAWGEQAYGPHHRELTDSGHLLQLTGVGDGALRWCYENASVVLAPSLAEGFGLPALEALDLGASLITSLDPALVEVSGDQARHLPADDADAWGQAIQTQLRRATGSDPGSRRRKPAPRTWDDVARETVEVVARP